MAVPLSTRLKLALFSGPSLATVPQLLDHYRTTPSEREAERSLATLTETVILPTSRAVLRRQCPQEEEALLSTVALAITQRLKRLREDPALPPVQHLEGYVAVVTRHTIDSHLRHSNPGWLHLRSRIRYRFDHDPRLALWEERGTLVCGRREWRTTHASRPLTEAQGAHDSELSLPELCLALLDRTKSPVALDELTSRMALLYGIQTQAELPLGSTELVAAPENLEVALAQHDYLESLWLEIRLLPVRQASALLLNLRDAKGRGVLELLLELEIATRGQIATTLSWTEAELTSVWERLPLEDNEVALRLGATRQQVINLRKVARERLERRMKAREAEKMP